MSLDLYLNHKICINWCKYFASGNAANDENKTEEAVTDDDIVNSEEMEVSENVTEDVQDMSLNDTDQMTIGYVKCPANLATKIHTVIVKSILPQLHKALTQKVSFY